MTEQQLSLTGRKWLFDHVEDDDGKNRIAQISEATNLSSFVAGVVAQRIQEGDHHTIEDYVRPQLKRLLPDPSLLTGVDKAVERLLRALENDEVIGLFGDYDVDGMTATATFATYWAQVGGKTVAHIPNRKEGYGPNTVAINALIAKGASLIITLDCGSSSYDVLEPIQAAGVDVIVVDHHLAPGARLNVCAVVNPHIVDEAADDDPAVRQSLQSLCAAGVCFMLVVALNRALRVRDHFTEELPEPNLLALLDYVATGTMCDLVPLTNLNRALVANGLRVFNTGPRPGFAELLRVRKIMLGSVVERDLGFAVGPLLNAAGRMSDAKISYDLLMTQDRIHADPLANLLLELNMQRGIAVSQAINEALDIVEQMEEHPPTMVVSGVWSRGIVGIIASQLLEHTGRSIIVVGFDGDGVGVGSCRAVPGHDISALVRAGVDAGLLLRGGGHAAAAGLSIEKAKIDEFQQFAATFQSEVIPIPPIKVGVTVEHAQLLPLLIREFRSLAPFGNFNEEPVVCLSGQRVLGRVYFGKTRQHIKLRVVDSAAVKTDIVLYRAFDRHVELGQAMESVPLGSFIDAVGLVGNIFKDPNRPALFITDLQQN